MKQSLGGQPAAAGECHEAKGNAESGTAAVNPPAGGGLRCLCVSGWRRLLAAGGAPGAGACQLSAAPEAAAAWHLRLPGPRSIGGGGTGEHVSATWRSHFKPAVAVRRKVSSSSRVPESVLTWCCVMVWSAGGPGCIQGGTQS